MGCQFISFPKSGRTWIRYALVQMDLAKHIQFHHDNFEYNDGSRPALSFDLNARRSRYINAGNIVYLHREPRDVMVSLYAQITGRFADFFQYRGTLSEFIRDPYFGAENLREFQSQWDQLCAEGVAMRITYESCHVDLRSTLRTIADYLQLEVSDDAIFKAVENSSFENMRAVENSGTFAEPWLRPRNGASKVRVGRVGGYRSAFSSEDQAYLDSVFARGK